jgi:hypothetical protein
MRYTLLRPWSTRGLIRIISKKRSLRDVIELGGLRTGVALSSSFVERDGSFVIDKLSAGILSKAKGS